MEKEVLPVVLMDGVVPVNVKTLLLLANVRLPKVGVEEKEGAPALAVKTEFDPPWEVTEMAEVPLPYNTPLVVKVPTPVPPLTTGSMPDTKLDEARLTAPEDNPPMALDWTMPDPKVEKTGAEVTVKDPPTETLPVVVKVEALIEVADKAFRIDEPATVIPELNIPIEE